jgi:predicted lipid-binding transport protein (Tim44 family)
MHEPFDLTTIIFALLAIFVLFKLRSVLGTRTGNERRPLEPTDSAPKVERGAEASGLGKNVVRLPGAARDPDPAPASRGDVWAPIAQSKAWPGLDAIAAADASFEGKSFLEGAKTAYEMIVTSFAAGNRDVLRNLLAKDVFDSFAGAIAAREAQGETVDTTFVSLEQAKIDEAALRGGSAQVSVRFLSKLITATKDRSGNVIAGNADKVIDVVDIWTFARETGSRDPNWKLVATETSH